VLSYRPGAEPGQDEGTSTMSGSSRVLSPAGRGAPAGLVQQPASVRRWARAAVAAQALFVASWLIAASWQGPRYSVLAHSISDMYAVTAPGGQFLVDVFTFCGAMTIVFAIRSAWSVLRPGGWTATAGAVMLALSVLGLGDLLSPGERLACRLADHGCTTTLQLANAGGKMDNLLTSVGVPLLVLAGFFLAAAMRRTPGWRAWAWPARLTMVLILAFAALDLMTQHSGLSGLFERLIALTGAAAITAFALGILRRLPARPAD
jgi:hypothetical protein